MACGTILSEEDVSRFRTKPCRRVETSDGCPFGKDRCQYSHNQKWPRRCPFYLSDFNSLRYLPLLCPDINSDTGSCIRKLTCPYAHTEEEIVFHPLGYKSKICPKFKDGECRAYYCHYAHVATEIRDVPVYNLPYTRGVDVPMMKNVKITAKTIRLKPDTTEPITDTTPLLNMRSPQDTMLPNPSSWGHNAYSEDAYSQISSNQFPQSPFPNSFDLFNNVMSPVNNDQSYINCYSMKGVDMTPTSGNPISEKMSFWSNSLPINEQTLPNPYDMSHCFSSPMVLFPDRKCSNRSPTYNPNQYSALSSSSVEPIPLDNSSSRSRFPVLRESLVARRSPADAPPSSSCDDVLSKAAESLEQSVLALNDVKDNYDDCVAVGSPENEKARVRALLAKTLDLQRDVLKLLG